MSKEAKAVLVVVFEIWILFLNTSLIWAAAWVYENMAGAYFVAALCTCIIALGGSLAACCELEKMAS